MKNIKVYFFGLGGVLCMLGAAWGSELPAAFYAESEAAPDPIVADSDSTTLRYPFHDRFSDPYTGPHDKSPLFMGDPSNIKTKIEYDPDNNQYNINENMGQLFYRSPSYMSFEEFVDHEFNKTTQDYWRQRASEEDNLAKKTFAPKITVNSVAFDRIFGGNTIDIRPQGSAELSFGLKIAKTENPGIPTNQRTVTTFDFNEKIQMNVIANIGDKMKLTTNYNTEATFDFDNKMKLEYTGYEDDIIKKIEAGNVTLPLNSQLIQGSQSLFGIKTQLQFGKMTVTSVFSQQKGKSQSIDVQGGAQTTNFDIKADQYEANRHFFLGQYFKDNYDHNLRDINRISSGVNITRIEVWITPRGYVSSQNNQNRNIIAFSDLGENVPDPSQTFVTGIPGYVAPSDSSNNLYPQLSLYGGITGINAPLRQISTASGTLAGIGQNFNLGKNYETVENARLLLPSEYTVNPQLGYISLNNALDPGQVLAVAYEYTINGVSHRVGELTSNTGNAVGTSALFVKLIRSTNFSPRLYTWGLMMKNIYSLGSYNVSVTKFRLDVLYQDDRIGGYINYLPDGCSDIKGIPLLRVMNLDDLNTTNDPQPDGIFDFVPMVTINPQNGRIIFPVLEPFGSNLREKFCGDNTLADQFVYEALYDSTKTAAQQQPEKNKFTMRGSFQSSSGSDIPLNAVNIPPGSVKVTAGGNPLVENQDYTVDYTLGRVKIIRDDILRSNTPIHISLESNALFNLQTKTMIGSRFDYVYNKNLQLGGTILHLTERPLTQKVNIGDEPISNTIIGVDGSYKTDSRFITKILDKLPFYNTKETSNITVSGEIADLIPGHSSAIGKSGISYIDDFEGSITPLDLKNPGSWYLASTPMGQTSPGMFPEGELNDSLAYGYNRAKISWYYVDPVFQQILNNTPIDLDENALSNHYLREIPLAEIFPNKSQITPTSITCMNLAFYPEEKGPYNYDVAPTALSAGINASGGLNNPKTRWGGIMRKIETSDFEASNIEFIQFWLMDPFADGSLNDGSGGELYINLGSISEDILRDGHKGFENGLPASTNNYEVDTTVWGFVPTIQSIVNAFDNDPASRIAQDIGLDGLNNANEDNFFSSYLSQISANFPSSIAYSTALRDPSTDDYIHFLDPAFAVTNPGDALARYKKYNGMEGNSPENSALNSGNQNPDAEDINRDNNMDVGENYFQYKVLLKPGNMEIGQNYITDIVPASVTFLNNTPGTIKWYQFKIPINAPEKTIGEVELQNMRFIRMFMKGCEKPLICRFAKLEFLRGEWRRYDFSLLQPGEYIPTPEVPGSTAFDISSVSLEENSGRSPVAYILPPGIEKERDIGNAQLTTLNEQSLALRVCDLADGDARAAYRNTQLDLRSYEKLKMFVHAEARGTETLQDGELHAFIRLGSDFNDNYYEYDIPLTITPWNPGNPDLIWPEANNMEIILDDLVEVKLKRNNAMQLNSAVSIQTPFTYSQNGHTITVKGVPNLESVRSIMIGLRNPKDPGGTGPKLCAEVWVNELRLTDFKENGGWAATSRVTTKLADLGTMTLIGYMSRSGWGSIEKKVGERDRFDKNAYDFSTSVELGKFLPEKSGLKIPMYFGYSEAFVNPEYNPLDPDVLFDRSLNAAPNPETKKVIKERVRDYQQRKSLNFTGVRKVKTGKSQKSHIYDVENLNFSYAYTEFYSHDYNTEYNITRTYSGIVGYNYNSGSKPIQPLEKAPGKFMGSKWMKLVKEFNFNPIPSGINFRAAIDRSYSETQLRNNTGLSYQLDRTYIKTYTMQRNYGLNWDLTKSLKVDFNADASATIDEPPGRIDTKEAHDSIQTNLKRLGRLTRYHHSTNVTYQIPFGKFPLTDWVSGNIRYGGDYMWTALPLYRDTLDDRIKTNPWGNSIQNAQTMQYNANLTLTSLYNKVPYLKKISQNTIKPPPPKPPPPPKTALDSAQQKALRDSSKAARPSPLQPIFKGVANLLMMVKTASGSYSETNGTLLPGFLGTPDFLGQDWNYNGGSGAPTTGFIFGSQKDPRPEAIRNHWITTDSTLNTFFTTTRLKNLSLRATVEPVKSFKIEFTGTRNFTLNHQEYFRAGSDGTPRSFNAIESGNFSISYFTWSTHFVKDAADYSNKNFDAFRNNLSAVSTLMAAQNPNYISGYDTIPGYKNGYGPTQQEVLTYSFLSGYSGKTPSNSITTPFPKIPLPNWRVTYDGFSKFKSFQRLFQSFTISHGYRSTYSVNSFTQNLQYTESNGKPSQRDTVGNFIPKYENQQITIAEQLAPLIGIDIIWKNSLQTRFEIKRDRTLTLAYSNIQVTEVRGIDYTIGLGYKLRHFTLPFKIGGKRKLSNDLTLKGDFNLRDNTTILRKLVEGTNQPSAGTKTLGVKLSADYPINDRFNVRLFYDYMATDPFVSSSYPNSNTNIGFSLRFTLAQ